MSTGMMIDGIATSNALDSAAERIDIENMDISDLEEGRGVFNFEHQGDPRNKDAEGKDEVAFAQNIVGKIVFAKKIFKESDCDNARQKEFWKKVEMPFVYIVGRLWDGAGHPEAIALAAAIRDSVANNEPIIMRYSIHGVTMAADKSGNLKMTIAKQVAITLTPCNKTCDAGLLEDPHAPEGFDKKPYGKSKDLLAGIMEKNEGEVFVEVASSPDIPYSPYPVQELNKSQDDLFSIDFLAVETMVLAKSIQAQMQQAPAPVMFGGKVVLPGSAMLRDGRQMAILSAGDGGAWGTDDLIIVPIERLAAFDTSDLGKLPKAQEGDTFVVKTYPTDPSRRTIQPQDAVSALCGPDQSLLQDLDLTATGLAPKGGSSDAGKWVRKQDGSFVYVLRGDTETLSRSALFSILANGFFQLGEVVPPCVMVTPPGEQWPVLVQAQIPNAQILENHADLAPHYSSFISSGLYDKLAIMDLVLGLARLPSQYVLGDSIQAANNQNAFQWLPNTACCMQGPLACDPARTPNPAALAWLYALDPEDLSTQICLRPVPFEWAQKAHAALYAVKHLASITQSLGAPLTFAALAQAVQIAMNSFQKVAHVPASPAV